MCADPRQVNSRATHARAQSTRCIAQRWRLEGRRYKTALGIESFGHACGVQSRFRRRAEIPGRCSWGRAAHDLSASSGSCSIASASANCRTPPTTETSAATRSVTSRARARCSVPNLVRLGLANIKPLDHLTPPAKPAGCFGKGATRSPGKDTTTGHWEMAGIWLDQAFPVYPHGFPPALIAEFERRDRPPHARQQARLRHRNPEGTRRRTRAHRISDRLHLRRQRFPDRRARRRDSRAGALSHVRNRAKAVWTVPIAWGE